MVKEKKHLAENWEIRDLFSHLSLISTVGSQGEHLTSFSFSVPMSGITGIVSSLSTFRIIMNVKLKKNPRKVY